MAITTFIPTIWEARLLAHLDKALIYGNLCNRDYEGDISQAGDTVIINQIGDIAIKDYKRRKTSHWMTSMARRPSSKSTNRNTLLSRSMMSMPLRPMST